MSKNNNNRTRNLFLGLALDAIGMLSFAIPGIGEFSDVIWAPLSAWLMTRIYKGKTGQIAGVVTFVEELAPGLDFIPSFTLMWVFTYLLNGSKTTNVIAKK